MINILIEKSCKILFISRSTIAVIAFGQMIDAYICLDIHRVSATKYMYYIGTTIDNSIQDFVKGVMTQTNISITDACNRPTPYETNTFITLVKDGECYPVFYSIAVKYDFLI